MNQFSFICPIFNAPTKIASCAQLRYHVWRGEGPEVRKGCQACMAASKCPALRIFDQTMKSGEGMPTEYVGDKQGRLNADVLNAIRPVVVLDYHMRDVPVAEREMIESANERIDLALKTAPQPSGKSIASNRPSSEPTPRRKRATPSTPTVAPAAVVSKPNAAATGDMSAAIN